MNSFVYFTLTKKYHFTKYVIHKIIVKEIFLTYHIDNFDKTSLYILFPYVHYYEKEQKEKKLTFLKMWIIVHIFFIEADIWIELETQKKYFFYSKEYPQKKKNTNNVTEVPRKRLYIIVFIFHNFFSFLYH